MIIALGESIVAVGVGASGVALGPAVLVAVVLGIALAAALWWAYFDLAMLTAERRLFAARERSGRGWLETPTLTSIFRWWQGSSLPPWASSRPSPTSGPAGHDPGRSAVRGVALYLLGHNAFRLRDEGSVSVSRLVVAVVCLALIAVAVSVPSIITLAFLTVLLCALAVFETATSREFRRELRAR